MAWVRRKSVRVLGTILAIILVAVLGVKVFLPAEKIRDLALDQAREQLGRDVSVGEVAVSLRGGLGVRLADFAIHNPDGFGGDDLLRSRALDLKLAIGPLLKGEVRVHRLVIEAPVVNLLRQADGRDNFTFAQKPAAVAAQPAAIAETTAEPASLSIASLTLKHGTFAFTDASADAPLQHLKMEEVTLGMSLDDPAPGQFQATGRVTTDKMTMTVPVEMPESKVGVDFDLTWDQAATRLEIHRADGKVDKMPLQCTGELTLGESAPVGKLRFEGTDLALVDLAKFAPAEVATKISGDRDSGTVAAQIELVLTGDSEVPVHTTGTATVRHADLALAQPFMPPGQEGRLAGQADLDITFADTTGVPSEIGYHGTATVRGVSFTDSGLVDELQDLNARLAFTPTEFAVEQCRAQFASGTFDVTGKLADPFPYFLPPEMQAGVEMKTPHLTFDLRSKRLDVDKLLPAASPTSDGAVARPAEPEARMARMARVPSDLEFPNLTSEGTFAADSLIYMQVPLTGVTGQVQLADRVLSVREVVGSVYQGQVDGQVEIDLNDLNDPSYTGSYQAQQVEVDHFVTRFAGLAGVVFGGCNMSGSFAARGLDPEAIRNSLTLNSDADIKEGKVVTSGDTYQTLNTLASQAGQTLDHEQALRDLATHITVENGRVGLNALTTRLGQFGDVTFDGYYGFNGDLSYNGTVLLTAQQTDELFRHGVLGELAKLLGAERPERLSLPLSVGGTRDDPKVKLDLSAVTDDLQKRAAREQGRKLEEEAKNKLGDLLKKWK